MRSTSTAMVARARKLRRAMSPPEVVLWRVLRSRPGGFKFRRQHPIGGYVLDFYCPRARLAVEIDGVAHDTGGKPEEDAERDGWLSGAGIRTLRIPAGEMLRNEEGVPEQILGACSSGALEP